MPDRFADAIPLPDHLLECGCPSAKNGRHLTSCIPAQEYDVSPLRDRPGYGVGKAFRSVSWEYPFRMIADVSYEVEIDVAAYIAAHQEDYDEFVLEAGYEEWEKPMLFISAAVEEDTDVRGHFDTGQRWISRSTMVVDDIREHPRWTPEDTDRLSGTIDPNQGTLDV